MLKPNEIPDKEPLIRVGIILPEDKYSKITIELPKTPTYQLVPEGASGQSVKTNKLCFNISSTKYIDTSIGSEKSWRLEPIKEYDMGLSCGIKVNKIIAGRGFHWEKYVDVYLPGSIELKIIDDHLILVNELPLEEYLMCVATSEMGSACPPALIESQTIAARSWMLANIEQKHVDLGMDVCNDDCCQRYQGSGNLTKHSIEGARNTSGKVLIYHQSICDARYSKSCGGIMETFSTIWKGNDLGYLKNITDAPPEFNHPALPLSDESSVVKWLDAIPDTFCSSKSVPESSLKKYLGSVDEEGSYFRWKITYSQEQLTELLNEKLSLNAKTILAFKPIKRGGSGRISELEISYRTNQEMNSSYIIESEYRIRQVLHKGFLFSSAFYLQPVLNSGEIPTNFIIKGAGWGHGVGLCQIGALGMSLKGYPTDQILEHYYPGSEIQKIY
jgi:SpoIID/LytB domain protein